MTGFKFTYVSVSVGREVLLFCVIFQFPVVYYRFDAKSTLVGPVEPYKNTLIFYCRNRPFL